MVTSRSLQRGNVIVVGGGIVGIACAHYLSKDGWRVTVIDQGRIGGACSHANCGYICPSHVLPLTEPAAIKLACKSLFQPNAPFRVRPTIALKHLKWFVQFARRCNHAQVLKAGQHLKAILDSSVAEYRRLIPAESLQCEWRESGLLYVLRSAFGMRTFADSDRFLTEHFGVTAQRIAGRELSDFDPALKSGLAGGFYYPGDASVRPDLLNARWTQRLTERGVTFHEHCRLQRVRRNRTDIEALETSRGEMKADHYVFALGAWSPTLQRELRCKLPVQPGKGYSVTMARPESCPRYPMLFPEHKVGVSPFADGYRLGSMMEFAGYDTRIHPKRIDQLRRSAAPYLVATCTDEEQQRWYGWRPMTWDSLPIIGPAPAIRNAHLATGHNMLGLSLATGTGKLLAELLSGRTPHLDASAFSPTRFQRSRPGHALCNFVLLSTVPFWERFGNSSVACLPSHATRRITGRDNR